MPRNEPKRKDRARSRSRSRSSSPRVKRKDRDRDRERKRRRDRYDSSESESGSRSRSHSRSPRRDRGKDRRREKHSRDTKGDTKEEKQQRKEKEERKRQKDMLKALETPEQKRARRLAKKQEKLRHQRQKEGWNEDYLGYTNADNPFGDQHLLEKFVWDKKREQEATELKLTKREIEEREEKRQEEMRRELQKAIKRKAEREKEREAREQEMALLNRMKEAEMFKEWESQEDEFHLEQAKLRSKIRIESGRAKPIDLLAKYINSANDDDVDIEVQEPYHLLRGLNLIDLEDLLEDIKVYCEIEQDSNTDYWIDMTTICEEEVNKLRRLQQSSGSGGGAGGGAEGRAGINAAVSSDVSAIFKGKTYDQLVLLEQQINTKINSNDPGTDVGYWESLLQQLKAHMARARLRDRHQALLRKKLFSLRQQQLSEAPETTESAPLFPSASTLKMEEEEEKGEEVVKKEEEEGEEPGPSGVAAAEEEPDTLMDEEDLLKKAYDDYEAGAYSPKLLKPTDVDESEIMDPEQDQSDRTLNRQRVMSGGTVVGDFSHIQMTRNIGKDGIAEEEYNFSTEVQLGAQAPIWKEKYRPRKPRFFNRVHTGFEWNKYNQTHYDTDNPPPKIVQGYKFNIFYPDLIDKRKTPQYNLTPCADNPDFAILRFHAGPPYEDIAFRIVNREWECSWRFGFRSQFSNNILQLWFRFKRNRYRR